MRPGFWSDLRYTKARWKADKSHLENAPLGPRQRKNLAAQVVREREALDKLNAELRETKKKFAKI